MTSDRLCALACQALVEPDARAVLADALEESGWAGDENVARVGAVMGLAAGALDLGDEGVLRAVTAVLLLGAWPTSWPLAGPALEDRVRAVGPRYGVVIDAMMTEEDGGLRVLAVTHEDLGHPAGIVSQLYDAIRAILPRGTELRLDFRIDTD